MRPILRARTRWSGRVPGTRRAGRRGARAVGSTVTAELRLRQHQHTLSELADVVSYHRFHEDPHAKFMLALYRSGHRSRALEAYQRLRKALADELGLEPSPKLQSLMRNVLLSDSSLSDLSLAS